MLQPERLIRYRNLGNHKFLNPDSSGRLPLHWIPVGLGFLDPLGEETSPDGLRTLNPYRFVSFRATAQPVFPLL